MTYNVHAHRPIFWEQDQIRAVGDAMRESGSCDWYALAGVAARALFPTRESLILFAESLKSTKTSVDA